MKYVLSKLPVAFGAGYSYTESMCWTSFSINVWYFLENRGSQGKWRYLTNLESIFFNIEHLKIENLKSESLTNKSLKREF